MRRTLPFLAVVLLSEPSAAQSVPVYLTMMGEPILGVRGERNPFYSWFAQADTNHDGSIDPAEMQRDSDRFFATLDVDRDGKIGPDEITRYETEVAPPAVRAAGGMIGIPTDAMSPTSSDSEPPLTGTRLPDDLGAGSAVNLGEVPEPVTMADTNLNGSVSAAEFNSAASRRFFAYDTNHDGRLEPQELMSGK